jgi:hypothetical protein
MPAKSKLEEALRQQMADDREHLGSVLADIKMTDAKSADLQARNMANERVAEMLRKSIARAEALLAEAAPKRKEKKAT